MATQHPKIQQKARKPSTSATKTPLSQHKGPKNTAKCPKLAAIFYKK
jgi:hypothetical protein